MNIVSKYHYRVMSEIATRVLYKTQRETSVVVFSTILSETVARVEEEN